MKGTGKPMSPKDFRID
jgi:hypothetical protein